MTKVSFEDYNRVVGAYDHPMKAHTVMICCPEITFFWLREEDVCLYYAAFAYQPEYNPEVDKKVYYIRNDIALKHHIGSVKKTD